MWWKTSGVRTAQKQIEAWKEVIKIARGLARSVGMIPAIDAADEDNNDDDNDGHDGSEVKVMMGEMQVVKTIGFTVPLNAWGIHFVPTRMKTTTTTDVRPPLVTKTILVLEVHPFQITKSSPNAKNTEMQKEHRTPEDDNNRVSLFNDYGVVGQT
ncbi:hypothetical protein OS493_038654 [Desmophyllum pertusum]|uniref:Uncharacterized protein n=1 Tax=Desmophyllum pertusum TaxID=174260 RepID=A0A9W9ZVJ4_9CNID|nr:hypothetical protein OS493_038654 [Desmophyllum pertusum]